MYSMTGFGSAMRETSFGRLAVEARSVNNRFLEINCRLGSTFLHLEPAVRGLLRDKMRRGKVDITVRFDAAEDFIPPARINMALLKHLLAQLHEATGGKSDVRAEGLLGIPGVLLSTSDSAANEQLSAMLLEVLNEAVDRLIAERAREGETLRQSLLGNLERMRALSVRVESGRGDVVERYRDRLRSRLDELLGSAGVALDTGRLEQEVAVFADRADIAEECARLSAHLDALEGTLTSGGEGIGRSLEFLSQEILREVNTLGSKCRDLDIARAVLELKNETESLRENLANVE